MIEDSPVLPAPVHRRVSGPQQGHGAATAHHGEILQGMFAGPEGHPRRGLVTLPCAIFGSQAAFDPAPGAVVAVEPGWKHKARLAVELALASRDLAGWGGRLTIRSNIPPQWGFGSSTCDITAALRALADAFQLDLPPATIAAIAVRAEMASDSIMFEDRAVLFAQRDGVVLEEFGGPLPALDVVGFNTDPAGAGVDTLNIAPAAYSYREVEAFRPLIGLLRRAIYAQDPRLVARVASASARINQRHLPKPQFERLEQLVESTGALGLQVAHSGTIAGIVFDPADGDGKRKIRRAQALIAELGFGSSWHFRTNERGERRPDE